MRVRRFILLCALAGGFRDPAAAQSIGIFADDCATTCITVPQFATTTFYLT